MGKIHHLFIIDPIESLNLKLDSSLRMSRALSNLGHDVAVCTPSQIDWLSRDNSASCTCQQLSFANQEITSLRLGPSQRRRLDQFTAIHMRKDPPYDLHYISCTWLLDSAAARGVVIFNAPEALRNFNEKLSIFRFPQAMRDGLVSSQTEQLLNFIDSHAQGDAILKPLTLFGGRGVLRLSRQQMSEDQIRHILNEETRHGEDIRLIQPFDRRIFEGEVRAFTAGGRPVSWCVKRPQNGNFLANTRSGATIEAYNPTAHDVALVTSVAQELYKEGVFFIGFDVIGGYISEINITSPRLLHAAQDTRDYYAELAKEIEAELRAKQKL